MPKGLGKGRRVAPKFCQAVVLFLERGINGERCSRKAGCAGAGRWSLSCLRQGFSPK